MKYSNLIENVEAAAELLKALSSDTRLHILRRLVQGEVAAGTFANEVGLTQSALSQHLVKLSRLALVQVRRDAQTRYYRCDSASVKRLLDVVSDQRWTDDRAQL